MASEATCHLRWVLGAPEGVAPSCRRGSRALRAALSLGLCIFRAHFLDVHTSFMPTYPRLKYRDFQTLNVSVDIC